MRISWRWIREATAVNRAIPWTKIQLIVALILGVGAFVVFGYWAITLVDRSEEVQVAAAAADLKAPRVLSEQDMQQVRIRRELLPQSAIADVKDAVGLTLIHPISKNQVLTINELQGQIDPELGGFKIPAGAQGLVLPAAWLAGSMPKVKSGDFVTILVSGTDRGGSATTGIAAEHLPVRSVESGSDGILQRILLIVDVKIAASILQARAGNLLMEVLVEGQGPPLVL